MTDQRQTSAAAETDLGEPTGGDTVSAAAGIDAFVPFFKAFCNGTRAGIVEQLLGGERCVCELTAGADVSQPLVSHHLAVLRATGFVRTREEGTRTYYAIDWERFDGALDEFRRFVERRRAAPTTSCACR